MSAGDTFAPTDPGSGELLGAARAGSASALTALLERHLPSLRAYVRLQVSPFLRRFESESDVVQSVCRELIARGERFDYRGEAAFRSWLYQAVLNKVRDHERHHKAAKRSPPGGLAPDPGALAAVYDSVSPSRVAAAAEQVRQLEDAFGRLPESYSRVLSLHHIVGLDRGELARELAKTPEAVSQLLRRATVRLSRELVADDSAR